MICFDISKLESLKTATISQTIVLNVDMLLPLIGQERKSHAWHLATCSLFKTSCNFTKLYFKED